MNEENIIVSKQASKQSRRLSWVDVLKGIGIILVVVGHVYLNRTVRDWLYSFHMPLFFLAAGWLYKEKPILTDIKRRIQTIVVPYFSFGLLVLLYWQVIERRSLIVLCIHGPVYRVVVKIISIPLHMGTDAVREKFLLAMLVMIVTMVICSLAYEIIVRVAPWMIGKKKVKVL